MGESRVERERKRKKGSGEGGTRDAGDLKKTHAATPTQFQHWDPANGEMTKITKWGK